LTDAISQNPFAPPRAHVQDPSVSGPTALVTATRGSRLLAILVDASPGIVVGILAVIGVFSMMPGLLSGQFDPQNMNWGSFIAFGGLIVLLSIGWVVWQIVLLYRFGQTVGKKALGIRVVRMDGSRVSFARFFFLRGGVLLAVRLLVGGIALGIGLDHGNLVGALITLVDSLMIFGGERRCLHDYIADTQVVTAASSPNATLAGSTSR
jgi:uncharacterized RDD family membrane protein YckC